ncbi:MAG: hypothetical protein WCP28_16585, partial [Actinomycetes bacterium]
MGETRRVGGVAGWSTCGVRWAVENLRRSEDPMNGIQSGISPGHETLPLLAEALAVMAMGDLDARLAMPEEAALDDSVAEIWTAVELLRQDLLTANESAATESLRRHSVVSRFLSAIAETVDDPQEIINCVGELVRDGYAQGQRQSRLGVSPRSSRA